jgi:hypothetical protein
MSNNTSVHEATHCLTWPQLDAFLAANGLELGLQSAVYVAGDPGTIVGRVTADGDQVVLSIMEAVEPHNDEGFVKAWWPDFRRAWIIVGDSPEVDIGPCLEPDEAICDLCNALVLTRPVAVVGSYALCQACFEKTGLPFPGSIRPYVPQLFEKVCEHA